MKYIAPMTRKKIELKNPAPKTALESGLPIARQIIEEKDFPRVWLMKSEPDVYSIRQLKKDQKTIWEGVRNFQARNFMRDDFKKGDGVLFYHSNAEPSGIVGLAKVSSDRAIPDPSQFNIGSPYFDGRSSPERPLWFAAEVEFVREFNSILSLDLLRKQALLSNMLLLQKGQRLSILPVRKEEMECILRLADV